MFHSSEQILKSGFTVTGLMDKTHRHNGFATKGLIILFDTFQQLTDTNQKLIIITTVN
jgi:hypothetical protein